MIGRLLLAAAALAVLATASYYAGGHELLDVLRSVNQ